MTTPLFTITTDQFSLTWSTRRSLSAVEQEAVWRGPAGHLSVRNLRANASVPAVDRFVPRSAGFDDATAQIASMGPRLSEETEYVLYVRAVGATVELRHDDPTITAQLRHERDGVVHGTLNFRSNVGFSDFEIMVDGRRTHAFTVEVFPSKLDYKADYEALLADVQGIATSLALEYLRSTYRLGRVRGDERGDDLQWVLLLRHIFEDLERGVRHIAARPRWGIVRDEVLSPIHRIRRADAGVRRSIRRRQGSGPMVDVGRGVMARGNVWSRPARPSLDTPEHRWLAHQLHRIQQRLSHLVEAISTTGEEESARRTTQITHLRTIESAVARLRQLDPIAEAEGPPPPGFASQQLISAPGYREAYQACLILNAGLNLEGDALRLSTKEVHQLYEYWCYLVIVRLLGQLLDRPVSPAHLFKLRRSGLRLDLARGRDSEVVFDADDHRVRVRFNPSFPSGEFVLVPQRPDVLVTLERDGWPPLHLVIDAKYRVDTTSDYLRRYKRPGPPDDALNVLYRYRDAILEEHSEGLARHAVQAAAVFPGRDSDSQKHDGARYWESLDKIGVGAFPALPGNVEYLEQWLRASLLRGGWHLADKAIPHAAHAKLAAYRRLERERVWLALADDLIVARARDTGTYQLPLAEAEDAARADNLALLVDRGATAELWLTRIHSWRSPPSSTPNRASPSPSVELQLGFATETLHFERDTDPQALEGPTSQLAVRLATSLSELVLDRLEDWQLRDELRSRGRDPQVHIEARQRGHRPWIRLAADQRARYEAGDGYAWQTAHGTTLRYSTLEEMFQE